jgi:predicted RNA-binding Zn ribbon-like protein
MNKPGSSVPGEDTSAALALVNTRRMSSGQPTDSLAGALEAGDWLARRGLAPSGTVLSDPGAERLRALRETIRSLFAARADGRVPAADDLAALNAALAAAPEIPSLTWDAAGPRRGEPSQRAEDPCAVAIARLAGDALRVLTDATGPEPAPCGAHGCIRWFLRTHAARQWCSTRCGDRVRAARHYARHHSSTALD